MKGKQIIIYCSMYSLEEGLEEAQEILIKSYTEKN